ncbi:MAG: hypothetical protein QOG64_956 [Acidimicrobiaceae bacterium]|nr:hypothetical protein [Acidimicrobiaceae bacterium]
MATLVFFHAHPDDEAVSTAGSMAKAAAEGHRVVLVTATRGEHGEVAEGYLKPGEELWQRRVEEVTESARILGCARHAFLGYVDSGMMGTPENEAPESFWQADLDEAAERLAQILREEQTDVLVAYDENGNYGHPDHIQVHRVGVRAAELAGVAQVFEATMNRDAIIRLMAAAREMGGIEGMEQPEDFDPSGFGTPESLITTEIDVADYVATKRKAMEAHGSQIADTSFFLAMPPEVFATAFGTEWYIHRGVPSESHETSLV